MPLGARGVGGRGPGGGGADPGTAPPCARPRRRAHDRDADRRAAREGAVRQRGTALLPAVRPAGLGAPIPRSYPAACGDHRRDRDLAHALSRARTAAHPARDGKRARLDPLGRPLPAHGVAVPRDAVARHPDRRPERRRCGAVSGDRRAPGPRARHRQREVRPRAAAVRGGRGTGLPSPLQRPLARCGLPAARTRARRRQCLRRRPSCEPGIRPRC